MHDWKRLVEERLGCMRLPVGVRDEVCTEIANHLEERFEHGVAAGKNEADAEQEILSSIADWKSFARKLARERKPAVTTIGRQFILPSGVALGLATLTLALDIRFGPPPAIWISGKGAFVVYRFWLFALIATGAASAWLSAQAGGGKSRRALVAITPALYMLSAMLCVVVAVVGMNVLKVMPSQHIHWMALIIGLANWVVLPAIALLLGALPLLGITHVHKKDAV